MGNNLHTQTTIRRTSLMVAGLVCGGLWFIGGCNSQDNNPLETIASEEELPAEVLATINAEGADPTLRLGYAVYSRHCVGCHGINGDGNGPATPRLTVKPRNFTSGEFKFRSTPNGQLPLDEDLHRTIQYGLQGSPMPAFEFLPDRERDAVIAFFKLYSDKWNDPTLEQERVQLPVNEPTDLMSEQRVLRGRYAYVAMGCHNCHGLAGRGDGPSSYDLQDFWGDPVKAYNYHQGAPKTGDKALDIYRTFRSGVTPMPMYASDTLGLVARDLKDQVFGSLVEQEQAVLEPIVDALPTLTEVMSWKEDDKDRYEEYSNERAWDLVAYTLWLRERQRPADGPSIMPVRAEESSDTADQDESSSDETDGGAPDG